MVDYAVGTGATGMLILSDDGHTVRAIIRSSSSLTFANGKTWAINVGGGQASGLFNINGIQDVVVWAGAVTSTLNISFTMGATGTSGMGGPTTLNATIQRATVPPAPTSVAIALITHTSMRYQFSGNGTGGSAITGYDYQYSVNANMSGASIINAGTSGLVTRTDLLPGTRYYWRSRSRNAVGASGWSGIISGVTLAGVRVRVAGVWRTAIPYVRVAGVWRVCVPYVKHLGVWKAGQ